MDNYEIINKGTITLGDKVMVSDPCYGIGTWCQGVIENVLPGKYVCKAGFADEGNWGTRVADIRIVHEDYTQGYYNIVTDHLEEFEVGVDSGTAGIFDYEYYKKYHKDSKERDHADRDWYNRTGNLTFITKRNPNYVEFNWDYNAEDIAEQYKRYREWTKDVNKSWPTISCFDANTIDDCGFVSSSGYGDGGYSCWTARNDDGKVIAILVEFINDDDEEDEEE